MVILSPLFIGTVVAVGLGAVALVLWIEAYRRRSCGRRWSRRGLESARAAVGADGEKCDADERGDGGGEDDGEEGT